MKKAAHNYIVYGDLEARAALEDFYETEMPDLKGNLTTRRLTFTGFIRNNFMEYEEKNILMQVDSLSRLRALEDIAMYGSVYHTNESYENVNINPGSVIYCDIPYEGGFDHRKFDEWFLNSPYPTFVSSYDFGHGKIVMEVEKVVNLQGGGGNTAIERLYWNGVTLSDTK